MNLTVTVFFKDQVYSIKLKLILKIKAPLKIKPVKIPFDVKKKTYSSHLYFE